jgi:3-isopropylmalate dehydrogenase
MCCAQAQHGSAPTLAGKDMANPVSMILSVAMLLAWLGKRHARADLEQAAALIDCSVDAVLENPAYRTADLGGTMRCQAFAHKVAQQIAVA